MGVGSLRDGGAVRRARTAVSEIGAVRERAGRDKEDGVVVRLSPQARRLMAEQGGEKAGAETIPVLGAQAAGEPDTGAGDAPDTLGKNGAAPAGGAREQDQNVPGAVKKLSEEEKQLVVRLSARDTAVHAHEAAHQAAARGLGGAASFTYETGPDGRRYAVGGEVPVALRSGRTPQETISNAQVVRSAALAPSDPSSQDMAVASEASQMEAEARQEITRSRADGTDGADPSNRHARVKGADGTAAAPPDAVAAGKGSAAPAGSPVVAGARGAQEHGGGTGLPRGDQAKEVDSEHDPLMIFSTLKAERGVVNGHLHSSGGAGCAFCSRAAARYA